MLTLEIHVLQCNLEEHHFKCVIKLDVPLVENLNYLLQFLQDASVLVRGLKNLDSGVGKDSAMFSRYSF